MATNRTLASNLSLRQLRAFLSVAEEASMTRAATRLHLTPSALSMLVRGMEEELGFRLFERTTRRLQLTEAGRQLLPTVQQVFDSLEQGISSVQQAQHLKAAQLRVATSPLLASGLVPQVIARFRATHPQVRVQLLDAPVESLATLVREQQVDLAVGTANTDAADLRATRLVADRVMLVCRNDHPLAGRDSLEWRELQDAPLVLLRAGSGLRVLADQALARWRRGGQLPAYEVSHVATALGLVEAGEGVAVLPSYAISRAQSTKPASQQGLLVSVPLTAPAVRREIVALTRVGGEQATGVADFISQFRKVAGRG